MNTFEFIPALCSGCGACVSACMDAHGDFSMPPRRVVRSDEQPRGGTVFITWYSEACVHCEQHPCVSACPKGCFALDAETGLVLPDSTACIGCRRCEKVCGYNAVRFTPDGKMKKCDGCIDRRRAGLAPRCVSACPQGAIRVR